MTNDELDSLKKTGMIKDYTYANVSEDGRTNHKSKDGNSETVTIYFHNGACLTIESILDGCDSTSLWISLSGNGDDDDN
jgi:hypothetical protein